MIFGCDSSFLLFVQNSIHQNAKRSNFKAKHDNNRIFDCFGNKPFCLVYIEATNDRWNNNDIPPKKKNFNNIREWSFYLLLFPLWIWCHKMRHFCGFFCIYNFVSHFEMWWVGRCLCDFKVFLTYQISNQCSTSILHVIKFLSLDLIIFIQKTHRTQHQLLSLHLTRFKMHVISLKFEAEKNFDLLLRKIFELSFFSFRYSR